MIENEKLIYNKNTILKKVSSIIIRTLILICLMWLTLVVYMYFNQDKFVFFPQIINTQEVLSIKKEHKNLEEVTINTQDGNNLCGWLVKGTKSDKSPLIIYFGGNAEEVSNMISETSNIEGWYWALINYRGYGISTGKPSEKDLFSDAETIYDYLYKRSDIDNKKIIVFGRSLGTGVAVHLANSRQINGLILVTPYDSITNVAKEQFPILPINLLFRNKFDSISQVSFIKVPTLVLGAENDEVISIEHARKLVENFKTNCTFKVIDGVGHNTINNSNLYWDYVRNFMKQFN